MDEKKTFLHYLKYQKNYSVLTLESYDREMTDFLYKRRTATPRRISTSSGKTSNGSGEWLNAS